MTWRLLLQLLAGVYLWGSLANADTGSCPNVQLAARGKTGVKVWRGHVQVAVRVKNRGNTPVMDGIFKLAFSSATGITLQKAAARPRGKGIEFVADSPNFYWRGVNIPARSTLSFFLKLQVSYCAPASSRSRPLLTKWAKAAMLYATMRPNLW